MAEYKIVVIGAGVVGLSTAVCIQNLLPSSSITIIADKFDVNTLSNGAAGLFRPESIIDPQEQEVIKWCQDSYDYFLKLFNSPSAKEAGVEIVSGYHLYTSSKIPENKLLKQIVSHYHHLTPEEREIFPNKYKSGTFYTTVLVDCRYYLPWLIKKFKAAGGNIQVKHIENLTEISDDFDVVVNCTGLGAKQLLNDDKLVPIRGQIIKVKAPWIKHFFYGDHFYVCPGIDHVTLGGVKDYGTWDINVNQHQKQDIWENCTNLVPSLRDAEIIEDWVGLRPYRSCLCLESNIVQSNEKLIKVVNNYGHGGHGVSLSWGTAKVAANLVKNYLEKNFFVSKL